MVENHSTVKPIRKLSVGVISSLFCLYSNYGIASTTSNWPSLSESRFETKKSTRIPETELTKLSPFAPGSNNIALDLGQIFLIGDLAKYSDSIGSQLHYTYGVSPLFGFDSSFGYSQHSNGQFALLSLVSGLRMNLSWYDKVVPYGIFGLGFYKPTYQNPLTPSGMNNLSAILFGVHLGAGVDLELSRNLFFGAALTIHNMFGTSTILTNGSAFSLGGTVASFLLHIGATF